MKLRLLTLAATMAASLYAQTAQPLGARVILQSGTYSLTENQTASLAARTASSEHRQLRVMAFNRPLTELEWATWSALGAVNHGYLPLNAYLVEFQQPSAWSQVADLPFAAGSPFLPEMKLSSQLASGTIPDYAWVGAEVELIVVP
ncbi:MAG: hypothetical protein ACKOX0_05975 [Bacteroidota bacterium]